MTDERRRALRSLFEGHRPVLVPGAPNALIARLVERAGFEAVYVSGAGIANASLGVPDLGLVTLTELVTELSHIREATSLPLLVDADTGFGNALNTRRSVRELEQAGASAVQLEDQVFPKRCGHFDGKRVVSAAEMCAKLAAAVDARRDSDLVIVARTDARAELGLDEAIERGHRYLEAGADALFIEAPTSAAELGRIASSFDAPLVANMVEGGRTPILSLEELGELGFRVVLYANTALRAATKAAAEVLAHLRSNGSSRGIEDRLSSWAERQEIVGYEDFRALEARYAVDPALEAPPASPTT